MLGLELLLLPLFEVLHPLCLCVQNADTEIGMQYGVRVPWDLGKDDSTAEIELDL